MRKFLLAATLFVLPPLAAATPLSGRDLLATCEAALRGNFSGMDAAMCEWFTRPCEVCGVEKPRPTHCLPSGISARELAALVASELQAREMLRELPAKDAVERVLSLRYPCRP